jgi:integrase
VNGYIKKLKYLLNQAIRQKLIKAENNPCLDIKLKYQKTKRIPLTVEEIKAITELDLPTGCRLYHARNIFLFCYLAAGTRISDALLMKAENIKIDYMSRSGRMDFEMKKTGSEVSLPMSKALISLIAP